MTRRGQCDQLEQKSTITVQSRAVAGALAGVPLGLGMGTFAALSVSEQQSLGLWLAYLVGSLFAFVTFGAFIGAMTIPRRGDD